MILINIAEPVISKRKILISILFALQNSETFLISCWRINIQTPLIKSPSPCGEGRDEGKKWQGSEYLRWRRLGWRNFKTGFWCVPGITGLICLGKSHFEAIENYRGDQYLMMGQAIERVPSTSRFRWRLDENVEVLLEFKCWGILISWKMTMCLLPLYLIYELLYELPFLYMSRFIVDKRCGHYHGIPHILLAIILLQENGPSATGFQKLGQFVERCISTFAAIVD